MAITLLPDPPNPDSPSSFDTLAYPFVSALSGMVPEINAALAKMGMYATAGGTANAIMLTGVLPAGASSVATGTAVRFRASAANTGATTINLDGVGAIACRTITGVALPSGYIRTDADTVAVYDGTFWVVSRETEYGSNANGDFWRFAGGLQICNVRAPALTASTALGQVFASDPASLPLPANFASGNPPFISGAVQREAGTFAMWLGATTCTTTTIVWRLLAAITGAVGGATFTVTGRWY